MKLKLMLLLIILMSCNDSTGPKTPPYGGEPLVQGNRIKISTKSQKINLTDTFTIKTSLPEQKYRINGKIILMSRWRWRSKDTLLYLLSPEIERDSFYLDSNNYAPFNKYKIKNYKTINVEFFPNKSFTQNWKLRTDSNKIVEYGDNRPIFSFEAFLVADSVLLDMDTLYGGPWRPIPVKEKRWYNLHDSVDIRKILSLGFNGLFGVAHYKYSERIPIYISK